MKSNIGRQAVDRELSAKGFPSFRAAQPPKPGICCFLNFGSKTKFEKTTIYVFNF